MKRHSGVELHEPPSRGDSRGNHSLRYFRIWNTNEVFRVVISKESNDSLEVALSRCSDGFDSGTITKSDVANYVFQNLAKFFSDSDVKTLRATHFDEKKVLGSILRNDDDLPEDLRKAIRAHFGIAAHERDRKRASKQNDNV